MNLDWFSALNWGDVPSWISVLIGIGVPLVAYLERNRIAGFFRRQAREPLPGLPPARFALRPIGAGNWALINGGEGEAFNVTLSVVDASAAILSSGFWSYFPPKAYGTFALQLDMATRRYPDIQGTTVVVSWQDKNGERLEENMIAHDESRYKPADWPRTGEGKVVPIEDLVRNPEG